MKFTRRAVLGGSLSTAFVGAARAQAKTTLRIESRQLEVNGKAAKAYAIVNSRGGVGHSLTVQEPFRLTVENAIDEDTLLHWHGLTPPSEQDGVPDLAQPALKPGGSHDYDFPVSRAGTFWMHSHVGLQEQQLMAAPLIVRDTRETVADQLEHVILLHDFTFRSPQEILEELRKGGGAHASHSMSAMPGMSMDHSKMDHGTAEPQPGQMAHGAMMGGSGMVNDVVFDAYLANDRTLADPEVVTVEPGMSVRLRIINGSAASNMWVDLGALEGELIAVDGHAVAPMAAKLLPLAIAQRADIRLRVPKDGGAWPILFRAEGLTARSGVILASKSAAIAKVAAEGEVAPVLDLMLESQLRSLVKLPDEPVTRTEMLMLTGGGPDYVWGLNGKSAMHEPLFSVRQGERIDVMMHNMTGMSHPMHLHGHVFKVVNINGVAIDGAVRDTVLVPPNSMVAIRFDADNPGNWAFHCHHMYHMNSGMMGSFRYTSAA